MKGKTTRQGKKRDDTARAKDVRPKKKAKEPKGKLREPLSMASYSFSNELYATKETVKEKLERYGVAVIPSLLSPEECAAFEQGVWDTLGKLSAKWPVPVTKDNKESWRGLLDLMPQHSMLFQHFAVGHAEFVWALRQNPKVVQVFSHIWGVPPEELLVSFDGIAVHMPPEVTKRGAYKNSWYANNPMGCFLNLFLGTTRTSGCPSPRSSAFRAG